MPKDRDLHLRAMAGASITGRQCSCQGSAGLCYSEAGQSGSTLTPHPVPRIATLTASSGAGCTADHTCHETSTNDGMARKVHGKRHVPLDHAACASDACTAGR